MTVTKKYIAALFLLTVMTGSTVLGAEIVVSAQVDASESIYAGQLFTYYIIINGSADSARADTSELAFLDPQFAGEKPQRSQTSSNINGRITRKLVERNVLYYKLTALEPGKVIIPSVNVTVAGKTYKTNPIPVTIVEPGTTPQLAMEMSVSKQSCYVGEPIVLDVKWFILETIAGAVADFNFDVPVLSSGDFIIDDSGERGPKASPYNIGGVSVYLNQKKVNLQGEKWVEISFSKILMPKLPGTIKIDSASVLSKIAVSRKRSARMFSEQYNYKRFVVETEAIELEVLSLPKQAKPKGFYGLIGEYKIATSATPTEVNVGEPITLTIAIEGHYLKPVQWPDLEGMAGFAANFKIPAERSSPVIKNGSIIFTQTIRANSDSVTEIPAVALPCFETDKGEYITVYSDPISLEVAPTSILTSADIQGRQSSNVNYKVEATRKGINANYDEIDLFTEQSFSMIASISQPAILIVVAVPFGAFVLSLLVKLATFKRPGAVEAKVRRNAGKHAIAEISKLSKDSSDRHKTVISIMQRYVGDRFDRVANSIVAGDCREAIISATGNEELAESFKELFEACENACYTGANVEFDPVKLTALIRDIERGIGK